MQQVSSPSLVSFALCALLLGCALEEPRDSRSLDEQGDPSARAEQAASITCCSGPWRLLTDNPRVTDLQDFASFTTANGYPLHSTGGEILGMPDGGYRLGVTGHAGAEYLVISQYLKRYHANESYCEFFTVYEPREPQYCPPQGGVLFIQPDSSTSGVQGWLRSESDTNCNFYPGCPDVLPGACYGARFGQRTVKEVWVR